MSDFRRAAHLEEQLGYARWEFLLDPQHTGVVRTAIDEAMEAVLPKEIIVGGRRYEVLNLLLPGEREISGSVMVARGKEAGAEFQRDEVMEFLANQKDIPEVFHRGDSTKIRFVFPGFLPPPNYPSHTEEEILPEVAWVGGRWVETWSNYLSNPFDRRHRVLRKRK